MDLQPEILEALQRIAVALEHNNRWTANMAAELNKLNEKIDEFLDYIDAAFGEANE